MQAHERSGAWFMNIAALSENQYRSERECGCPSRSMVREQTVGRIGSNAANNRMRCGWDSRAPLAALNHYN
jgi:hypothetical protein